MEQITEFQTIIVNLLEYTEVNAVIVGALAYAVIKLVDFTRKTFPQTKNYAVDLSFGFSLLFAGLLILTSAVNVVSGLLAMFIVGGLISKVSSGEVSQANNAQKKKLEMADEPLNDEPLDEGFLINNEILSDEEIMEIIETDA